MVSNLKKVLTVVGARPQLVKAAVISRYLRTLNPQPFVEVLVHTGQHYDHLLSDIFFQELGLGKPKYNLQVGSHESSQQLAMMMERLDPVIREENPQAILVYGDTNSTLAAALCSMYKNIPLIHVEAGERIYRRHNVPEEGNRVLTDTIAFLCLTSTARARDYLLREGVCPERIQFVGDPMYDLFLRARNKLSPSTRLCTSFGLVKGDYHVATIHRVENTTNREQTISLLRTLDQAKKKVLLPLHPRLRALVEQWKWSPQNNLCLIEPLGYFEFLSVLMDCDKCITDSGGVTREAFFAQKLCLIPMSNSWWKDIVESGWARETGNDYGMLADALESFVPPAQAPEGLFGDGKSAQKIVDVISNFLEGNEKEGKWHRHGNSLSFPREKPRRGQFTLFDYGHMIDAFRDKGYIFATFPETEILLRRKKPFVLMRHDVDMDLEAALHMAQLEATRGIQSTYFFLLRTEHYNVFSAQSTSIIHAILALGHKLGLHFDCAQYPENSSIEELSKACSQEAKLLEEWFGRPVQIVSYHRPNALVLSGNPKVSFPREHTYMPLYNDQRIKYFSDSKGEWRFGSPLESGEVKKGLSVQILIHPTWWTEYSTSAYETLLKFIQRKNDALERSLATNCSVYRVGCLNFDV